MAVAYEAPEADPVAEADLAAHAALTTAAHGGIVAATDGRLTDQRTPSNGSVAWTKIAGALVAGGANTLVADPGGAAGDILVRSGATFAALAKGSTGQQVVVRSDGTLAYVDQPAISLAAWQAVGDFAANDTAPIQAALDASETTGRVVEGVSGKTYKISKVGTKAMLSSPGSPTTIGYCLQIGSNAKFNLNGSTLKLDPASADARVIVNKNPNAYTDTDIRFWGGTIDGNNVALTDPLVYFAGVQKLRHHSQKYVNVVNTAVLYIGCSYAQIAVDGPLLGDGIAGNGFGFGQVYGAGFELADSTVGTVEVRNVAPWTPNTFNFPGNPIGIAAARCKFGRLVTANCSAGIKLQRPSHDIDIDEVVMDASVGSSGNSGFKVQGDAARAKRINIGKITARDQYGNGLYLEGCDDVVIGQYFGKGNAIGDSANADVWIGGSRIEIGQLHSQDAQGDGVLVRPYAGEYTIRQAIIRNAGAADVANTTGFNLAGGNGRIGLLKVMDALYPPEDLAAAAVVGGGTFAAATYYWRVTATNANGETISGGEASVAVALNGQATLTWTAVTGATGYKVYRSTTSNGQWTTPALVASVGAVTTYTDTGSAVGAGSVPTFNTAAQKKLKYGFGGSVARAKLVVTDYEVSGCSTAQKSFAAGAPMRAQKVVTGPPETGEIVLATESAPAFGASVGQFLSTGRYVGPPGASFSATAVAQGVAHAVPLLLQNSGTLDRIGIETTVNGEAGSVVRLGIYNDDGSGLPGTLLLDAGTVPGDGGAAVKEITISQVVGAGIYWLVAVNQLCPTTPPTIRVQTGHTIPLSDTAANASNPGGRSGYQRGGTTGALPATWGGAATGGTNARPIVRAA